MIVGALIKLMPTGIMVTYEDENGKSKKRRLSVLKRSQWIDYLNSKCKVA